MKALHNRISQIEGNIQEPAERLTPVRKIINCSCQVKHPELFNEIREGNIIRLQPKDPDFKCSCNMKVSYS